MFLFRLSEYVDLEGRGGLAASGRFHTKPQSIIYSSGTTYGAYLEILRQITSPLLIPAGLKMLKIMVPDDLAIEAAGVSDLASDWHTRDGIKGCQRIGDEWLASHRTPILKVPSAAHPDYSNYLMNPAHRDAKAITLAEVIEQPFPDFVTKP